MAEVEQREMVECAVCTLQYDVSARTARDVRAERVEPRCGLHRKARPRSHTKVAQYRRFWLDQFSMDEIREMAMAFSPLPSQRAATVGQALIASAAPPGPRDLGGH